LLIVHRIMISRLAWWNWPKLS